MLSIILWFIILSSGGVICAAVWGRRYEETLPITCSGIVLVLFLAGIFTNLFVGEVLVCILSGAAYITALIWVIKKKNLKEFVRNFFTPGFVGFILILAGVCYFNYGRMAYLWDEFSHWADIVKVMTLLDDFGTNPQSYSLVQSYPPGMSLFQYFLEKLYLWTSLHKFSEWRLYASYQVFILAFFMPFLKKLDFKQSITAVVSMVVILLCPLPFYQDVYASIYIDPAVAILSGIGLASIFINREKNLFYLLWISSICSMLVLAKDAGLLFAAFIVIVYILDYIFEQKDSVKSKNQSKFIPLLHFIIIILSVCIPKLLWSWQLKRTNAKVLFSKPYNIAEFIQVIKGEDTSYRMEVWYIFRHAVRTRTVDLGVPISYFLLFFIEIALLIFLVVMFSKYGRYKRGKGWVLVGGICVQLAVYLIGLFASYIFKFSNYEAVRLASFERYMNIAYLSGWIVVVLLLLTAFQSMRKYTTFFGVVLLGIMFYITPMRSVKDIVSRATVFRSINVRATYTLVSKTVEETVPEGARIYIISQEDNGFDHKVIQFSVRPCSVQSSDWSIGIPFYDGDVWTRNISPEEWSEVLFSEFDYVLLYKVNDYFVENYAGLFENAESIGDCSVYRVNKDKKILEKCGG